MNTILTRGSKPPPAEWARWTARQVPMLLAALVLAWFSYGFGQHIGGPLMGLVLAANGALMGAVMAAWLLSLLREAAGAFRR